MKSKSKNRPDLPTLPCGQAPAPAKGTDLLARSRQQPRAGRGRVSRSQSPKTAVTTVNIEFGPWDEPLVLAVWADDGGFVPDTGTEGAVRDEIARQVVARLPELERILRSRGYSDRVVEGAIDRIIDAAVARLSETEPATVPNDWNAWLFGSGLRAAPQVASRLPQSRFTDPAVLDTYSRPVPEAESDGQWLTAAVALLTARQRRAVELCVLGDRSLAEAARVMDCHPSTVGRHLDRALRRLRREINHEITHLHTSASSAS